MGLIRTTLLRGVQALVGAAPTTGVTVLDDDSVVQTLPVVPEIARRSLSLGETGWWIANLNNIHTAADAELSQINPYAAALDVPDGSAFPVLVPATQDLWLIGAHVVRISGAGDLNNGALIIDPVPRQQAFGRDDLGAAVVASGEIPLALWGNLNEVLAVDMAILSEGGVWWRGPLRIPRNANILFRSDATATATFSLVMILGLFPESLGQDVLA